MRELFTTIPDADSGVAPKGETKEERTKRLERKRRIERDLELRERFRKKIQSRIEAGIQQSLANWKKYAAVDLAYDTNVVSGMTLPLMLYAQGKIDVQRAVNFLGGATEACKTGFVSQKKDDKGKEQGAYQLDLPRFVETEVNLVRSIIDRRHGAQKVKYAQLWPYYKYEARSTGIVAKCRADVLSQRMDQMADQFNYRHHESQVMLDGFLYANQLDVMQSRWIVEKQYRRKGKSVTEGRDGVSATEDIKSQIEEVITKEGLDWFNPHPTRTFWDNAFPLSTLNSDTGCSFFGFWDVVRFSAIDSNPDYFNKDRVGWTGRFWGANGTYQTYSDYFTHYLYTIIPPLTGEVDPAAQNDRKVNVATYTALKHDASVLEVNYYEKLVPRDWGIGDYPFPVWVRFICTQDSTVIFAEIMPSTPAAVMGMMVRDSRQMSVSIGMKLLGYQQQMTNLLTHMLLICQVQLFKAIGINKDLVDDAELDKIKAQLKGRNWCSEPLIYSFSLIKLQSELGIKPAEAIAIAETNQGATIQSIFDAMLKLVQLVEKLEALSPNEQGQPAPREISATEVTEIANTTSAVYGSISEDIDEYRAAKKRICYETTVACHEGKVTCPVQDRYTPKTIEAAGFEAKQGEDEDFVSEGRGVGVSGNVALRRTVIGSARALVHDYIFTSRDGAERPVNTQAANTLVQLIGQVMAYPPVAMALGKGKLFELFNEVFRLSGAGVDLNLQLKEGEDDSLGADQLQQLGQTVQQIGQALNQLGGQVKKNSQDLAQQDQTNQEQQQAIKHLAELAQQVKGIAGDVDALQEHRKGANMKLIESLNYKDAPDEIKAQIEAQAGFRPASSRKNSNVEKKEPASNGSAKK